MSMYSKVLLSLLTTALLPLLLVTAITYQSSKQTLRSMAGGTLEASAMSLARNSIVSLENAAKEMESWAALDTLQDVFTGEDIDLRMGLLLRELQANSDFLEIWCTDTNGKIVAASDFNRLGQQVAELDGVARALSGASFVSPVLNHTSMHGVENPSVCLIFPLLGAFDGETVIGTIIGFYDWHRIDERVSFQEYIAPQEGMHLFLMDEAHRIVARGNAEPGVVALLEKELPGLHRDDEMRTHSVTGSPFDGSRQLLAMATQTSTLHNVVYTGVAVAPEREVLQPIRRLAWFTVLACIAAVAGTFVLALVLSRRISGPITALSRTAREIARGNLALAPPVLSADEIGQLGADLDSMRRSLKAHIDTLDSSVKERTRQLEESVSQLKHEIQKREQAQDEALLREQQLRQADKMVSLGVLVSGVAHEINNPNGLIALNLGLLSEIWEKSLPVLEAFYEENGDFSLGAMNFSELRREMPVLLADTTASSERIKAIVDDLKGFSRTSDERLDEAVDLNRVVDSAINLAASYLKKATRNLVVELDPSLAAIPGNPQRLEQVVINLLLNACHALVSEDAEIRVVTRATKHQAIVEVIDQGRGIAPEDIGRITDPFFTTRRNDGGTGLGLSISAGIVEEHGGVLQFESQPEVGTTARLVLPVAPMEKDREPFPLPE